MRNLKTGKESQHSWKLDPMATIQESLDILVRVGGGGDLPTQLQFLLNFSQLFTLTLSSL